MRTTVLEDDRAQRLERVRAALERAETSSGLRPVEWGWRKAAGGDAPVRTQLSRSARVGSGARLSEPSDRSADQPGVDRVVQPADASWLPVPPALADLLPHGAVRRGTSLVVEGSTALLLHLTAALAADGAWTALVSHPDLGLAAALDAGLDPARCVMVPDPGPEAAAVLGAITDGFDVVAVGACTALNERDRRSLSQRIRHRGAVLLSTLPWPGSEVVLTVTGRSGEGLLSRGRLVAEDLTVTSRGRGLGAGRTRRLQVARDGGAVRLTSSPGSSSPTLVPQPRSERQDLSGRSARPASPVDRSERRAG